MSFSVGCWVVIREDDYDNVISRALTCEGNAVTWWHDPHPLVVMAVQENRRLLAPVSRDPHSKDPTAEPVEIARGDGPARYNTWLHVEVSVWANVSELEPYRGGPFDVPKCFQPHLRDAYLRSFTDTWTRDAIARLPMPGS